MRASRTIKELQKIHGKQEIQKIIGFGNTNKRSKQKTRAECSVNSVLLQQVFCTDWKADSKLHSQMEIF